MLEVGSGTGAILEKLPSEQIWTGLDLDPDRLHFAREHLPDGRLITGDGHHLPFRSGWFDASFCHFLLLWVKSPLRVLAEMKRVTRPAGAVMALAEPDYDGRIDHPRDLIPLGLAQNRSLEQQGAALTIGRQIRVLFQDAGLENIKTGILGAQWSPNPNRAGTASEHEILRRDIAHIGETKELQSLLEKDQRAWQSQDRILFVPTFFAIGRVPA